MLEIMGVLIGLWLTIVFASFCVWILDMGSEYENWQKNVTIDDLSELDKVLKN